MKFKNILVIALSLGVVLTSCNKDKDRVESFDYSFNTGQVAAVYAYEGLHPDNLSAQIQITGLKEGSEITVTLNNAVAGQTYMVHAHDAADAASTPNGTPYDETPNSTVFAQMITSGDGGTISATQVSTQSVTELTETYEGFFVVHDPLQDVNTTDPTTYVILGSFAR